MSLMCADFSAGERLIILEHEGQQVKSINPLLSVDMSEFSRCPRRYKGTLNRYWNAVVVNACWFPEAYERNYVIKEEGESDDNNNHGSSIFTNSTIAFLMFLDQRCH